MTLSTKLSKNNMEPAFRKNSCVKRSALLKLSNIFYTNYQKYNRSSINSTDDSLTSLNWLNNLDISTEIENSSSSSLPSEQFYNNSPLLLPEPLSEQFPEKLLAEMQQEGLFDPKIRCDYRQSWASKPPISYTILICMAIMELRQEKITLCEIYDWIRANFLYYRTSGTSWQNSVRHNLSLKKCFEKVDRRKDERGKGGFWRINPSYTENLRTNLIKYRRQFQVYSSVPATTTATRRPPATFTTPTLKSTPRQSSIASLKPILSESEPQMRRLRQLGQVFQQQYTQPGSLVGQIMDKVMLENPQEEMTQRVRSVYNSSICFRSRQQEHKLPQYHHHQQQYHHHHHHQEQHHPHHQQQHNQLLTTSAAQQFKLPHMENYHTVETSTRVVSQVSRLHTNNWYPQDRQLLEQQWDFSMYNAPLTASTESSLFSSLADCSSYGPRLSPQADFASSTSSFDTDLSGSYGNSASSLFLATSADTGCHIAKKEVLTNDQQQVFSTCTEDNVNFNLVREIEELLYNDDDEDVLNDNASLMSM